MRTTVARGILAFLLGFTLVLGVMGSRGHGATTILPPGETCFQQATGPVSSGSINMFVPSTTTPKNTWKDSGQVTLNTNPIQLDANGCAVIYGTGSYRQQVFTGPVVGGVTTGTLLYDVLTADTSSFNAVFWAGTSAGTPNAITVVDAGFNNTDGSVINFLALNTNTGSATLNVSGGGAIVIKSQSATGPIALTSGCITANNPVSVVYSSSAAAFLLLTPCAPSSGGAVATAVVGPPQGYLTLASASDSPIIVADTIGSTSVFYTPYVGNQIPIWNGTAYNIFVFSQLTLTLSASNLANTLYDVCIFSNSGTPVLVTGPAWTSSAAGTSTRGTGAGTTQLQRLNGIWVNAVQITGANGVSTFTVPANQCTYVGTILIDQAAGQVSNYLSWGQNRKWGVWNAYNRAPIQLQSGDSTASWTYNSATWRFSNNTGGNGFTALAGLPEEKIFCQFNQVATGQVAGQTRTANIGIDINQGSAVAPGGTNGQFSIIDAVAGTITALDNMIAYVNATPTIGVQTFNQVESGSTTAPTFNGTQPSMTMQCMYRG